ncbi:PIG-L deacetylase family protein [Actinomadura viridis]|uniref:LmbE family N-acetylglucosaminyl deacetylase n=1 Tax=Actinomadura viridis TaxID=58110 RepID=A0A931DN79_9ACTN|nr:PIG-L family deacetylase [Actinomadura viridis]MBG6093055.1 LmbE family N-acetylglucosaminyl deacetylase [Actinomadura viridis]
MALSPHLDDVALSAGGLLGTLTGRIAVVTVHGGAPPGAPPSHWDRRCGFASASAAIEARRSEDRAACEILGAEPVHLPHPDDAYGTPASTETLAEALAETLAEVTGTRSAQDTLFLVPAAIGHHPDHRRTRDAALRALAARDAGELWLYADQPYASMSDHWPGDGAEAPADEEWRARLAPVVEDFGPLEARTLRLSEEAWAVKHRAALAYASQLAPLAVYAGHFLDLDGPLRTELVWRVDLRSASPRRDSEKGAGGT